MPTPVMIRLVPSLGRSFSPRSKLTNCLQRRTFLTSSLQTLSEGFLDLAVALPLPASFPPYTTTIILTTVLSRLFVTLPFSIWAKKRQWRLEEVVVPSLKKFRQTAIKRATEQMAKPGARVINNPSREAVVNATNIMVKQRLEELVKGNKCSRWPTILFPAGVQMPLFIASTMFFSVLAQRPTPLDAESFLTLSSLARPDQTAGLPIALGLVTLANVESAHWFTKDEKWAQEQAAKKLREEREVKEKGHVSIPVRDVVQGGMRVACVIRIVIGAMVDGSVIVYWLTSATFGLFQTWGFQWLDARRVAKRQMQRGSGMNALP